MNGLNSPKTKLDILNANRKYLRSPWNYFANSSFIQNLVSKVNNSEKLLGYRSKFRIDLGMVKIV